MKEVKAELVGPLPVSTNKGPSIVVGLNEPGHKRGFLIYIGEPEANSMAMAQKDIKLPRPATYELLLDIIKKMGGSVNKVVIKEITGNTYYALIHINREGEKFEIDARPSDAINIALRENLPIFVNEELLSEDQFIVPAPEEASEVPKSDREKWFETIDPNELIKKHGPS